MKKQKHELFRSLGLSFAQLRFEFEIVLIGFEIVEMVVIGSLWMS